MLPFSEDFQFKVKVCHFCIFRLPTWRFNHRRIRKHDLLVWSLAVHCLAASNQLILITKTRIIIFFCQASDFANNYDLHKMALAESFCGRVYTRVLYVLHPVSISLENRGEVN
ncbi:hypothetical protein RIF29_12637 [Crotalaria pallida]|uniref:Uncharacterized protein n=1 Tax=Crotalaria pallida TaxID=3830 RepID=A0AAN9INK2_CROPI